MTKITPYLATATAAATPPHYQRRISELQQRPNEKNKKNGNLRPLLLLVGMIIGIVLTIKYYSVAPLVYDTSKTSTTADTVIRKEGLPSSASLDPRESNQHSEPLAVVTLSKSTPTSVRISTTNKDLMNSSTNTSLDPYDAVSDSFPDSVSGLPVQQLLPTMILPVNGNYSSYVNSDITNITHVPSKTRIEVHLHKSSSRRCQNPFLRGRLSGWSLSSIDFEFEDNYTDVLVGVYDLSSVPVSGTYYLEIIILLCERYSEEYVRDTTKNLANVCLETPVGGAHRITQTNASVQIQLQIEDEENFNSPLVAPNQHRRRLLLDESSGPKGRWLHKSLVETNTHTNNPRDDSNTGNNNLKQPKTNATIPLYTRYIPLECLRCFHWNTTIEEKEGKGCHSCVLASGVSQFKQYTYRWSDGPHEILNRPGIRRVLETYSRQNNTTNSRIEEPHQLTMVCFVGASHAGTLQHHCNSFRHQSLECQSMYFRYPNNLTESSILALLEERQRCTHVVIGLFQFPFCYHESTIHFSDWKRDMTTVVEMFKSAVASPKNRLEKILLRSAHPNALGFTFYKCPAGDYRTVPNAKMATSLLKEIVETHAIDEDGKEVLSLVDTSFLIDPVWDSAEDMSHYGDEAGLVEAKYILWKILSEGYGHHVE